MGWRWKFYLLCIFRERVLIIFFFKMLADIFSIGNWNKIAFHDLTISFNLPENWKENFLPINNSNDTELVNFIIVRWYQNCDCYWWILFTNVSHCKIFILYQMISCIVRDCVIWSENFSSFVLVVDRNKWDVADKLCIVLTRPVP